MGVYSPSLDMDLIKKQKIRVCGPRMAVWPREAMINQNSTMRPLFL